METMIKQGLSDQVRAVAVEKYVRAAVRTGQGEFSISVKDMQGYLRAEGFPENHVPQICTALQGLKFQRENGLVIEDIQGPPSKMSTTVVITYRVDKSGPSRRINPPIAPRIGMSEEEAKAKAKRVTDKIRGLLKGKMAAYGGGEAFLRWVRDENAR